MNYFETIQLLANNLLVYFDEIYFDAEIITNDKGIKFPGIVQGDEWINLAPTDQRETIYIRRNGDDEVLEDLKLGSCIKSYKMRSSLRVVYFQDHAKNHNEIIAHLMQAVLIGGTKLKSIIRDKWKLLKDESSGKYNFSPTTAYFAIDIYALWNLIPNTCEEDFCVDVINPLKKTACELQQPNRLLTQLLGFNGQVNENPVSYDNEAFRLSIQDAGVMMMRFPGGEYANSYNWHTDIPPLSHIKMLVDTTGCAITFVLNMITSTLADQLLMLNTASAMGIPVKYIEMGNEFNGVKSPAIIKYGSKEAYAAECATWTAVIKNSFPGCDFAIPGGNGSSNFLHDWNEIMLAANPAAFLVWHYHNPEYYVFDGIVNTVLVGQLIDAKKAEAFPNIDASRLWVTEFNLRNDDNTPIAWADDSQQELAASFMMSKFYDMGCAIILLHNVVGAEGNGAIVANNSQSYLAPTGIAVKDFIASI